MPIGSLRDFTRSNSVGWHYRQGQQERIRMTVAVAAIDGGN